MFIFEFNFITIKVIRLKAMKQRPYRKKKVVQEDFDKLTDYDSRRDMYYFHRRLKKLLDVIPKDKSIKILDFGGGSGLFSLELRERGYSNMHLVDASLSQCRQAREKRLKNVYVGDENYVIRHFEEGTFDFILMCDVIEHLERPVNTLLKIRKVLKLHGLLFITYPNPLWVPILNFLGDINLKLKGKDNKIHLEKIRKKLGSNFILKSHEGCMLVSMLPKPILRFFEYIEALIPSRIRRKVCILNVAVLEKNVD